MLKLLVLIALNQGVPIKSGATSDLATVTTNKAMQVTQVAPVRSTYMCAASGLTTTAIHSMQLEAEAARGLKIAKICVNTTINTTSAALTVTVQRRTTASSGGTAATVEGTASPAVSKMDPADGNFAGVCRITGTLGTAGPVLDAFGWTPAEAAAGTADPGGLAPVCRTYGDNGMKMPTILSGTTNGISVNVTAATGGIANGGITIYFIAE